MPKAAKKTQKSKTPPVVPSKDIKDISIEDVLEKAVESHSEPLGQLDAMLDNALDARALLKSKKDKVVKGKEVQPAKGKEAKLSITIPKVDPYSIGAAELKKECDSMYLDDAYLIQTARRVWSTGCVGMDIATGQIDPIKKNGGFGELLIFEGYGQTGKRKTNFVEQLALNILKDDPNNIVMALYTEDPDTKRLRGMGLSPDRYQILGLYDPGTPEKKRQLAERALMDLVNAAKYTNVKMIVIDSLKALVSITQMYEKDGAASDTIKPLEDDDVALRAKLMEKMLNRVLFQRRSAILAMVNQTSDRIPGRNDRFIIALNDHDNTPAGRFKEAISPVRIKIDGKPLYLASDIGGSDQDRKTKPQAGIKNIFVVKKNRWGIPNIKVVVDFNFNASKGPGKGFYDRSEEIFYYCKQAGLIVQDGQSYTFPNGKAIRGRDNVLDFLDKELDLREELYLKLIQLGPQVIFAGRPGDKMVAKKTQIVEDPITIEHEEGVLDV